MEVVVTTGAVSRAKLQSICHHQQTNTQLELYVLQSSTQISTTISALGVFHVMCYINVRYLLYLLTIYRQHPVFLDQMPFRPPDQQHQST